MRTCTACKKEKPLTAFGRNAKGKNGLHYQCKECSRKNKRRYDNHQRLMKQLDNDSIRTWEEQVL